MDQHNLKQRPAAPAVGVSLNWLRAMLRGADVNTDKAFRVQDRTLRHMAETMNAYAAAKGSNFRVTFEDLRSAARVGGLADPGDSGHEAPATGAPFSWTTEEATTIADAAELRLRFEHVFDDDFRSLTPDQRAPQFAIFRGMVAQAREVIRLQREHMERDGIYFGPGLPEAPAGRRPLTPLERKALSPLWLSNGRTWDGLGLDYVWDLPKGERLAELKAAAADAASEGAEKGAEG